MKILSERSFKNEDGEFFLIETSERLEESSYINVSKTGYVTYMQAITDRPSPGLEILRGIDGEDLHLDGYVYIGLYSKFYQLEGNFIVFQKNYTRLFTEEDLLSDLKERIQSMEPREISMMYGQFVESTHVTYDNEEETYKVVTDSNPIATSLGLVPERNYGSYN